MEDIGKKMREELDFFKDNFQQKKVDCDDIVETAIYQNDLFEMTNLYSTSTKLPYTIWISTKGKAKHGPRIKVDAEKEVVISIEEEPEILHGKLNARDFAKIKKWILKNKEILLRHWNGLTDGNEVIKELNSISELEDEDK
jgi:hypothetical protein